MTCIQDRAWEVDDPPVLRAEVNTNLHSADHKTDVDLLMLVFDNVFTAARVVLCQIDDMLDSHLANLICCSQL